MEELLKRINELALKEKRETLSSMEKEEQQLLRKTYVIMFRSAMKNILLHTKILDPLGNDVTPDKLKIEKMIHHAKKRNLET